MSSRRLVVRAVALTGSSPSSAMLPSAPGLATTDQWTGVFGSSLKVRFRTNSAYSPPSYEWLISSVISPKCIGPIFTPGWSTFTVSRPGSTSAASSLGGPPDAQVTAAPRPIASNHPPRLVFDAFMYAPCSLFSGSALATGPNCLIVYRRRRFICHRKQRNPMVHGRARLSAGIRASPATQRQTISGAGRTPSKDRSAASLSSWGTEAASRRTTTVPPLPPPLTRAP